MTWNSSAFLKEYTQINEKIKAGYVLYYSELKNLRVKVCLCEEAHPDKQVFVNIYIKRRDK